MQVNPFAIIAVALLCSGCAARPHKAKIVAVYQEEVEANDGCVRKSWRTTLHLDNDARLILHGRFGSTGDVFTAFYEPGTGWTSNP